MEDQISSLREKAAKAGLRRRGCGATVTEEANSDLISPLSLLQGYLGLRAIHDQVRAVDPEKASVVHLCRFFGTDKSARETRLLQSFLESNVKIVDPPRKMFFNPTHKWSDFQAYWEELEPNDQAVDSSSGEGQTNFRSILSNPDSFKGFPQDSYYEQLARILAYAWLVHKIAWDENSRKAWKDLIGLLDCGELVGTAGFLPPGVW
ncbi:hypothetical protein HDU88_000450 [Geranomyces variabilis]|nr:hypothetical protein HDU88_000450 [Geranomyces variabilis]